MTPTTEQGRRMVDFHEGPYDAQRGLVWEDSRHIYHLAVEERFDGKFVVQHRYEEREAGHFYFIQTETVAEVLNP